LTNFVKVVEQNNFIARIALMTHHPFSALLERKYLEWQLQVGRRSQQEFADYLGVKRPSLTMWMNGDHLPDGKNIDKVAKVLGPEVYDAFGLPRPDPNLMAITNRWDRIPPALQQKLAEDAARYEVSNDAQNTAKSSKRRKKRTAG
jgi:transcriptional regulator with XRE-family HTH domain